MPTRREVDRAGRTYSQWEFKKGVPVDLGVPMGGQDHKTAWAKKKKRLLSSPEYQFPIRSYRAFKIYVGYLIRFKTGQTINIPGSIELFFFSKPKIYLCQMTQNQ